MFKPIASDQFLTGIKCWLQRLNRIANSNNLLTPLRMHRNGHQRHIRKLDRRLSPL